MNKGKKTTASKRSKTAIRSSSGSSSRPNKRSLNFYDLRQMVKQVVNETARPIVGEPDGIDLAGEVDRTLVRRFSEHEKLREPREQLNLLIAEECAKVAYVLKDGYDRFASRIPDITETAQMVLRDAFDDTLENEARIHLVRAIVAQSWRRTPLPSDRRALQEMVRGLTLEIAETAALLKRIHQGSEKALLDLLQRFTNVVDNLMRFVPEPDREDLRQTVHMRLLQKVHLLPLGSAPNVLNYVRIVAIHEVSRWRADRARLNPEAELNASDSMSITAVEALLEPVVDLNIEPRQALRALLDSGLEPCLILTTLAYMQGWKPREIVRDFGEKALSEMAETLFSLLHFESFERVADALRKPCSASVAAKLSVCGAATLRQHQTESDLAINLSHWREKSIRTLRKVYAPPRHARQRPPQVAMDRRTAELDAVLARMQTPRARAAMKAFFQASTEQLGEAAVEAALDAARKRGE